MSKNRDLVTYSIFLIFEKFWQYLFIETEQRVHIFSNKIKANDQVLRWRGRFFLLFEKFLRSTFSCWNLFTYRKQKETLLLTPETTWETLFLKDFCACLISLVNFWNFLFWCRWFTKLRFNKFLLFLIMWSSKSFFILWGILGFWIKFRFQNFSIFCPENNKFFWWFSKYFIFQQKKRKEFLTKIEKNIFL